MKKSLLLIILSLCCNLSFCKDISSLWLPAKYGSNCKIEADSSSATIDIAKKELTTLLDINCSVSLDIDNTLVHDDGYHLSVSCYLSNKSYIYKVRISSATDVGLLYGTYELIRLQNTGKLSPSSEKIKIEKTEKPFFKIRILNHWDNLDGSIERGYAGKSIFWNKGHIKRLTDYARANASIGINATVLNNVNTNPIILSDCYLDSVKTIADILRPYGIKVFLSVNFGSPKVFGATDTADPLNTDVINWWNDKVKAIYKLIPDFGGFLVKASSEGQPGPNDYGRTHADGANMLADALKPFGGIVIWRSFVYGANHKGEDRVMQAVSEFAPMDGKFHDNVILQSKNGPLDFQPREPYAPIFDSIKMTSQIAELQITQEYTGQSKHLVYLAPMWKEFFSFVKPAKLIGIAGVANIGDKEDWCGNIFSQANWYAFGRLAWNPDLSSEVIAREWTLQTLNIDNTELTKLMEKSREACVNYMMPYGLHHIFAFDHHYGPEPDGYKKEYPIEWCPVYYHKADSLGIGFDRSSTTGTNAVSQYPEPYRSLYDNISTCPEEYLLWFHHVAWKYKMRNHHSLWENLNMKYEEGVKEVDKSICVWQKLRGKTNLSDKQWNDVNDMLHGQLENATLWKNTCLNYFKSFINKK